MVVGVLLAVVGGGLFVRSAGSSVIETFTTPVRVTPLDVTLDLDEGTYVIYEATAQGRNTGSSTAGLDRGATISADDVTVLDSSGAPVIVEDPRFDETIDRDNLTFTGVVRFTVDDAGPHRIQVEGSGQQVLVAPSLVGSFGEAVAWLGLIGLGVLLAIVGVVLFIVGLIRGAQSASPQPTAPAVAPIVATPAVSAPTVQPGWYDDPQRVARLRWWDGQQWTDYTS
jgi:hypothetical protein